MGGLSSGHRRAREDRRQFVSLSVTDQRRRLMRGLRFATSEPEAGFVGFFLDQGNFCDKVWGRSRGRQADLPVTALEVQRLAPLLWS